MIDVADLRIFFYQAQVNHAKNTFIFVLNSIRLYDMSKTTLEFLLTIKSTISIISNDSLYKKENV